ncbi:hypothetical protein BN1723_002913 [Verticillium longisporum]|uniref:Transcription factor domain-containing protein n=1 Tax=Verticillium longisporum TaxID=100787 RepID=A0A0G4LLB0_VERLO|nr:hypothetical protein BN1723_002913 [Verticillium longisporum]
MDGHINGTVQQEAAGGPSNTYATPRSEDIGFQAPAPQESPDHTEPASLAVENPLSLRHAEFTTSAAGVTYYLGTSSNWSFTRRVLNLTHSQVCNSPAPPQALIFDGGVYKIDWGRLKTGSDDPNLLPELPTLYPAIFLINTVQFNCCQLFHLFDRAEFMELCHQFYANPTHDIASAGLWYIHFCLVIALGKAFHSPILELSSSSRFSRWKFSAVQHFAYNASIIAITPTLWTYGGGGNLHRKYLSRAKDILGNIADVAEELRTAFPLKPKETMNVVSRTASHLHLLYHMTRFAPFNEYFSTLESLPTVRNLVRICLESSQAMISILECLMNQGLLGAFCPYDTEAIFVSTTNLLLGPAVDPQFINGDRTWLQREFVVFDDMINCGNQVAKFRKDELLQLDELLELFGTVAPLHRPEATAADATVPATQSHKDQNEPDPL